MMPLPPRWRPSDTRLGDARATAGQVSLFERQSGRVQQPYPTTLITQQPIDFALNLTAGVTHLKDVASSYAPGDWMRGRWAWNLTVFVTVVFASSPTHPLPADTWENVFGLTDATGSLLSEAVLTYTASIIPPTPPSLYDFYTLTLDSAVYSSGYVPEIAGVYWNRPDVALSAQIRFWGGIGQMAVDHELRPAP